MDQIKIENLEIFANHGVDDTTMNDIAVACMWIHARREKRMTWKRL